MKRTLPILLALMCSAACQRAERVVHAYAAKAKRKPAATATAAKPAETAQAPTEAGDSMPAFNATLLDGKPFDLTAERAKNVVLLNVWATWCGPCRFEIPQLQQIHDKYKTRGFEVVGVSVDENGAEAVKPFLKEQKIGYAVVLDPNGTIANLLQTTVLPTSVLIDRNGKILWRRIGALTGPDTALDTAIERALK
jgi:cytochrome c biogenesis protein CcmG/thiol:disulfide interchange protein DsbE